MMLKDQDSDKSKHRKVVCLNLGSTKNSSKQTVASMFKNTMIEQITFTSSSKSN